MIKIWDLPTIEQKAVEYFQSYGILPVSKKCINGHNMVLYLKTEKQCIVILRFVQSEYPFRKEHGSRVQPFHF